MNKTIIFASLAALLFLCSCHENMAERAEREAKEYTARMCPTPIVNDTRVDSLTFNKETLSFTYYYTLCGECDTMAFIDKNREELRDGLRKSLANNPNVKGYREAGFSFEYVIHSQKNPKLEMFREVIKSDAK